jgi:hypothetical protein
MKLLPCALTAVLLVPLSAASVAAQPVDVVKTNPLKVFMHYTPWFETPATLGANNWGYHWRFRNRNPNNADAAGKREIASHYYPKIGPYASSDPDVIEYHLLLMKLSGVDGVMIDWYGVEGTNSDIGSLLTNSNALVDRVDDFGLGFSVVMEDRFSANIAQARTNVAYLRDNYFNKPEYIRLGAAQEPLVGVFGPITFQQESLWTEILAEAGEPIDFLTLWYESADAGANADGEYAWVYEEENRDNHLTHQSNFYRLWAPELGTAGGVAYPGFNDFYREGGVGNIVPFEIPHEGGQTLDSVLNLAHQHTAAIDFLQLATFNDFGEGTMFEPTVETGFEYLKRIQQFTGVPYGEAELELVYRLYLGRKKYAGNTEIDANLDEVSNLLAGLDIYGATSLLDSVAPAGDFDADGGLDAGDDAVWRTSFGTATILFGSGADGNNNGQLDAADYVVWRNAISESAIRGVAAAPEPASLVMLLTGAMPILLSLGVRMERARCVLKLNRKRSGILSRHPTACGLARTAWSGPITSLSKCTVQKPSISALKMRSYIHNAAIPAITSDPN